MIAIEKNRKVTLPMWALTGLLTILISVFTAWGVYSASKAALELRADRNEKEIEKLREDKVDRNEFSLVLQKLNSIENKLDEHIQKNDNNDRSK